MLKSRYVKFTLPFKEYSMEYPEENCVLNSFRSIRSRGGCIKFIMHHQALFLKVLGKYYLFDTKIFTTREMLCGLCTVASF